MPFNYVSFSFFPCPIPLRGRDQKQGCIGDTQRVPNIALKTMLGMSLLTCGGRKGIKDTLIFLRKHSYLMLFSLAFAQEYIFIILLFSQMGQKEQTHYDFQHFICT